MPEWPDLHVLRARLEALVVGRTITAVAVQEPIVVRATAEPRDLIEGRRFAKVDHWGKFLSFALHDGAAIVVNPMLSGLFAVVAHDAKLKATTCVALSLDDGRDLRYLDDTKMGKVYLLRPGDSPVIVPGFADLGPDAGTLTWDAETFAAAVRARRGAQVRNLLLDQTFVAGIGNAYADEILWEARIHPRRRSGSLTAEELAALQGAIGSVLTWAAAEVDAKMPVELGAKPRSHMRIRGNARTPCPRCSTSLVLRHGGVKEMSFCPKCQLLEGSGPFGAPY